MPSTIMSTGDFCDDCTTSLISEDLVLLDSSRDVDYNGGRVGKTLLSLHECIVE
jgi:hypothetical protein